MRRGHQERVRLAPSVWLLLVACVASASCAGSRGTGAGESAAPSRAAGDSVASGGYGAPRTSGRRSSTVVTLADIERAGDMNLASFIESRLTGVRVTRTQSDYLVIITGSSFQSGIGALVLIDGTEGSLSALTLRDIASIEVLKDAAATVYGVRGANGVLLVTTRKR